MIKSFVSNVKELYFRVKYLVSGTDITYSANDTTARFYTITYHEFRRFQNLMGEEEILEDLLQKLDPTDVFFDVGANVGTYSCFAASKLDRGRVVAFEPEPANADRLRENASLNNQEIDLHRIALSDTSGRTHLQLDKTSIGAGQHSLEAAESPDSIEISLKVGDHLVNREIVPAPTILKIDVEGAELKVLRGLTETLCRDTCRLVYCEVHPTRLRSFGHTADQLIVHLEDCGFGIDVLKQMGDKFFLRAEKPHDK